MNTSIILGACIGGVCALSIVLMLYYIQKYPDNAKRILVGFLRQELRMALAILLEVFSHIYRAITI